MTEAFSSSSAADQDGLGGVADGSSSGDGGGAGWKHAVVGGPLPPLSFVPVPVETLAMLADRILVSTQPLYRRVLYSTSGLPASTFTDQCSTDQNALSTIFFPDQRFTSQCFTDQCFIDQCFTPTSDLPTSAAGGAIASAI